MWCFNTVFISTPACFRQRNHDDLYVNALCCTFALTAMRYERWPLYDQNISPASNFVYFLVVTAPAATAAETYCAISVFDLALFHSADSKIDINERRWHRLVIVTLQAPAKQRHSRTDAKTARTQQQNIAAKRKE